MLVDFSVLVREARGERSVEQTLSEANFMSGLISECTLRAPGFVGAIYALHESDRITLDQRRDLYEFLRSLGSDSAVLSYVPRSVALIFQGATARPEKSFLPSEMIRIRLDAPLLYNMLSVMSDSNGPLNSIPRSCLGLMGTLSLIAIETIETGPDPGDCFDSPPPPSASIDDCLNSGICCGLSRVRDRLPCAIDKAVRGGVVEGVSESCRHSFTSGSGGSHRTGGVFTWFCKHGICYAFFILPNAEGRDEAYSFLVCYFRVAPKYIIYDFACSLQEYCLNRLPYFFKDTAFMVDNFHWHNHSACARSFNLSLYRSLGHINSQIAEQCNSALQKIKPCVSQMKQVAFMTTMRLFLDAWNRKKISALNGLNAHAARF
jgi:Kyakuja-Dileera-Zisupton transposase